MPKGLLEQRYGIPLAPQGGLSELGDLGDLGDADPLEIGADGPDLGNAAAANDDLDGDVLAADFEFCTGRTEPENLGEEHTGNPYTDPTSYPSSDLNSDLNSKLNTDPRSNPHSDLSARPDLGTWLERAAARHTGGDTTRMASKLLDDFRRSALGPITLELPPADG